MTTNNILLQTDTAGFRHWSYILQHGVVVETQVNRTARQVLEECFNIPHSYVEDRIQTVFLDGMPVDDIDTAIVHDNARMGLAAALPGAAGIAMRRNSPYAALRGDITCHAEKAEMPIQGSITLLLFNLIMHEQGAPFLDRGVQTSGYRFEKLMGEHPASSAVSLIVNDRPLLARDAYDWAQKNPEAIIRLRVVLSD